MDSELVYPSPTSCKCLIQYIYFLSPRGTLYLSLNSVIMMDSYLTLPDPKLGARCIYILMM